MLSGWMVGWLTNESRLSTTGSAADAGAFHTRSTERTKGKAAMPSIKVESLHDTVTKFSHLPVTTTRTPVSFILLI